MGPTFSREGRDLPVREHVELAPLGARQPVQLGDVEIGREHRRALGDVCLRDRAPDALSGRGDDRDLALQTPRHAVSPCPRVSRLVAVLTMCVSRRSASSSIRSTRKPCRRIPGDVVGEQRVGEQPKGGPARAPAPAPGPRPGAGCHARSAGDRDRRRCSRCRGRRGGSAGSAPPRWRRPFRRSPMSRRSRGSRHSPTPAAPARIR